MGSVATTRICTAVMGAEGRCRVFLADGFGATPLVIINVCACMLSTVIPIIL